MSWKVLMVNNKNWAHYFVYVATPRLYEDFDSVRFRECIKRIQVCGVKSYIDMSNDGKYLVHDQKKKSLKGTWIGTHVVKQGVQAANGDKEY